MRHQILTGLLLAALLEAHPQQVTPAPAGPYRVAGNQIVDAKGRPYLMRGTEVREFRQRTAAQDSHSGADFGPHSATSLGAIRLRFNMNTVRVPLNVLDGASPSYFPELAKLVRRANDAELLVILSARETESASRTIEFWNRAGVQFKSNPNVMFEVISDATSSWRDHETAMIQAIRGSGAAQTIIATGWSNASDAALDDNNVIYGVSPRFSRLHTDAERDSKFAAIASRAPVLATGWDVDLENPSECASLPTDPSVAASLVQGNLDYFDTHQISWTVSVFEPGKLIRDLALHDATTLENGWTCGPQRYPAPGMGRIIEAHLRATDERGFFVVSSSGSVEIPRGGYAVAYGPVMAERDTYSRIKRLPTSMAGLHVKLLDAKGVQHAAEIFGATAGWGQINFVIPENTAVGPARMILVRDDGSTSSANITIADTAPGFWTGVSCRGAVTGSATQVFADGRKFESPISVCHESLCETLPIPTATSVATTVKLRASGFRFAGSADKIHVTIAGIRVPVVSYGPTDEPGVDQVTVQIPAKLQGLGEVDLIARLNGRASNPVRVRIGSAIKPAS